MNHNSKTSSFPLTIRDKFEKHKTETNALFEQALKKVHECDFNNMKEIIVMGELLFKKVEQMDVFDLSEYAELRQERKDLIKKLQELISQFDRYPKSVETFNKSVTEFHTNCQPFIELLQLSEQSDIPFLKKYELFNSLASVDHKVRAQQIQSYRKPITLFKPISKDMKVAHDNAVALVGKLFSLVVHVATIYEPMKRELPIIIQNNQDTQKYLSQVEQLLDSGYRFSVIGNTNYLDNGTFSQVCVLFREKLESSYQSLGKYHDVRATKDIHSRHVENTYRNIKKLEFLTTIFNLSPVFSNVCEELKNPSIITLSSCIDQLDNCKLYIEKLTKLEEDKSRLGELFNLEITKAISFYQYVNNQAISILSKLKDLEINTTPNVW